MSHGVTIAGTGSYLPEKILTNDDLSEFVETSDEWIVSRTGIKTRRIAAEGENTSHMAAKASLKALEQSGMAAEDIELIIVATITPDTLTPATACYVQQQLGANKAVAFDISAACSGFLYAMKLAKRMIESGAFGNALIIGAEKLSAFVDWTDRTTCVLFGDGAGAAVLRPSKEGEGHIIATDIGTDGKQTGDHCIGVAIFQMHHFTVIVSWNAAHVVMAGGYDGNGFPGDIPAKSNCPMSVHLRREQRGPIP
jgi:3-oxoacyl-[acyl-carrier-protein] synthase-3